MFITARTTLFFLALNASLLSGTSAIAQQPELPAMIDPGQDAAAVPVSSPPVTDPASLPPEGTEQASTTAPTAADVFSAGEAAQKKELKGYLSSRNDWNTTIMYSPLVVRKLKQVLEAYELSKTDTGNDTAGDTELSETLIFMTGKESEGPQFPAFYLSSIVYYDETDWTVWVNGNKISPHNNVDTAEMFVASVNSKDVKLVWRPQSMEKISKFWAKTPEEEKSMPVTIDRQKGTMTFNLKPNQTFDSYALMVNEGKVAPSYVPPSDGSIEVDLSLKPDAMQSPVEQMNDPANPGADGQPYRSSRTPEEISQELMQQYKAIGKFIPKKGN